MRWRNKGVQKTGYLTVNGWVEVRRIVYWNRQGGSCVPVDGWLGIEQGRYSAGVREMCCREASGGSFRRAAEDLERIGQIRLTHETMRQIVEAEGRQAAGEQQRGPLGPNWTSADCREKASDPACVIGGADGVKVPLVTEAEKQKRRQLRRRPGAKGRGRRRRIGRGSDQAYKEFKIVAFYDPSHRHQWAIGTSGDHQAAGRLMRRMGSRLKLDQAEVSYSVSDGADWIRRQFQVQWPLMSANVLDYYHLREHVISAAWQVFGEGSERGIQWREQMMGLVLEQGPLRLIEQIGQLRQRTRSAGKREALDRLANYVARRVEMLDYPTFRAKGYEIGSGPTEAFCKTLTARLKGPGMRWDRPNAEGMMALASIRSSNLWQEYWQARRAA